MDTDTILAQIIHHLPDSWATYVPFALLVISGAASVVAMFIKPPLPGVRHYILKKLLYLTITWAACNLRHAANSKQCGTTALQLKVEDLSTAKALLAEKGITVLSKTKPDT